MPKKDWFKRQDGIGKTINKVKFEEIYKLNVWGFGTGHGSLPSVTSGYRQFVQNFMSINSIKSVVDYGCGDWQFSRLMNWDGIEYLGLEIVVSLVERNTKLYGKENVKFALTPLNLSKIPQADLLIVKDVLQHLSEKEVKEFVKKILPRFRVALISNGVIPLDLMNLDIKTGEFRPLDLRKPPYNLKAEGVYSFGKKQRTFLAKERRFYDPWQEIVLLFTNNPKWYLSLYNQIKKRVKLIFNCKFKRVNKLLE